MTDIGQAIKVLNDGGIIIYPTDTAFGIGCRIDMPQSVDKLFRIRRRPLTQATPLLVDSEQMALTYYDSPSDIVRRLMKTYWPGALTIVSYAKKDLLYSPLCGGTKTVGLRMPNHKTALSIITGIGVPIVGPSANFHGEPTPYRFEDLDSQLKALVDFVVEGECSVKQASTVVDCCQSPYTIVRQGAVALDKI
jgi:L-threonylcarbamoyladenylate synthase